MSARSDVVYDDYKSGFIAGYQAIAGTVRPIPVIPAQPATKANMTPFLMGIRKGIERAGGSLGE